MMDASRSARLTPWILFLIFFAVLNETVFNVSTPQLAAQFGLTPAGVSWIMTVFMIPFGIGMLFFGKLSDLRSVRSLIAFGVILYAAASFAGWLGRHHYGAVLVARALQGAGASAIPALVFTAVSRFYPPERRGAVFGSIGSVVSLGIGVGPVLGGWISKTAGWPVLFLIPLLTPVALPFLLRVIPSEEPRPGKLDVAGAFLIALTVGAFTLAVAEGRWIAGFAAAVFFTGFLWRSRRASDPFVPPTLFRSGFFRDGVLVGFTLFTVVLGVLFLMPLMLHEVHGLDTAKIGLVLFPGAISSVFFGPFGGRLADRRGNVFVVTRGLALLIVGVLAIAFAGGLAPWLVGVLLLPVYVGFSLFQTALINSVSVHLPPDQTGVGMGAFNLITTVSGAVGTALVGKLLAAGVLAHGGVPMLGATAGAGQAYANLLVGFAVLIAAAGFVYRRRFAGHDRIGGGHGPAH